MYYTHILANSAMSLSSPAKSANANSFIAVSPPIPKYFSFIVSIFISNPPGFFLNPLFLAASGFETIGGSTISVVIASTGAGVKVTSSLRDKLGFFIYYFDGAAKILMLLLLGLL